jgi:hypothetical protein
VELEERGQRTYVVTPLSLDQKSRIPERRPVLKALRSETGEDMVLRDNFFVEKILPGAILRKLSAEEMAEYRRPFAEPGEGRRPTLTWPREIPIEGDPVDVSAIAAAYADWLLTSSVPKLSSVDRMVMCWRRAILGAIGWRRRM